jgi:hypothetical protein
LILLVAVQTFSKWCVILDYQVNRDFIAKNLCINRSKPLSCCKGNCYLNKKLVADETDQQAPSKGGQKEETAWQFFEQETQLPQPMALAVSIKHSTRYIDPFTRDHSLTPFEPPQRS